jgi:hypothetical protein
MLTRLSACTQAFADKARNFGRAGKRNDRQALSGRFIAAADEWIVFDVTQYVAGLRTVCEYLGLPFRYRICLQLAIDYPDGLSAGQWASWISAKLSARVYINPVGGRELFDPADFANAGVNLAFLDFASFIYDTRPYNFEKDLSVLDVLMWNSPDAIVQALRKNSCLVSHWATNYKVLLYLKFGWGSPAPGLPFCTDKRIPASLCWKRHQHVCNFSLLAIHGPRRARFFSTRGVFRLTSD